MVQPLHPNRAWATGIAGLGLAFSPAAVALDVDIGGKLQTDIRYRTDLIEVGDWYGQRTMEPGFSRNQNLFKLRGNVASGKARVVFDNDLVYMGFSDQLTDFSTLTRREIVDPFRIESHSLYIEAWDVGLRGLDLRIGQQRVMWGVGDQFNPTNNLNADDVEDPLLFGDQLGNIMVRADYSFAPGWTLSGVVVPIFKPALLPASAELGLAAIDRVPITDPSLRWKLQAEQKQALNLGFPTVVGSVVPSMPANTLENMQWSARLAGTLGMQDIALSYYDGRSDIPVAVGNHTTLVSSRECNPKDDTDCINGRLVTEARLVYPKMKVLGLNAAGEMNPLGWIADGIRPIGYRLEVAYIKPERTTVQLTNDLLDFGLYQQEAGEYDYGLGGARPTSVTGDPFMKWTAGLDYTFGRHVYVNAQWVHGFPDEFGAGDWIFDGPWEVRGASVTDEPTLLLGCAPIFDTGAAPTPERCVTETTRPRIGDYGVVGVDLMFGKSKLRVFTILDFTPIVVSRWDEEGERRVQRRIAWSNAESRSMVLYPELSHNFGNGMELAGGAVVMLGSEITKFGDPATGGTQVFTRASYSF